MNLLLVEDNRSLAKLVAQKIKSKLNLHIDIAYTLAEAKELVKQKEYSLSLLDLNLPDAPNGEVVGYIYSKQIPAIVLTASLDEEVRQKILKKDVIDFVTKTSVNDVLYIVSKIERLLANRRHKVMVVDDSQLVRRKLSKLLRNQMFQVIEADDGEDALRKIDHDPDVRMVITDYNMPKMDGFDLTLRLRETYGKEELAIIAISSDESELVSSKFLKFGATDFLKKPFSTEEFNCRINNTIENLENIETILQMANRDYMTGAYNRRYFFDKMEPYYKKALEENKHIAIAMLDIDKFKSINDTYGHKAGDEAIKALANLLMDSTKGSDMVARFGGEEFCVLLKDISREDAFKFFEELRLKIVGMDVPVTESESVNFTVSIGVVTAKEDTLEQMINESDLKLYQAKNEGRNRVQMG